jgi:hypothetical protein
MKRRLVIVTLVALGLSGLVVAPSLAAARSTSFVITGVKTIAGYKVGTTYAQALRYFGGAFSTTQSSSSCTARWKNGVTIVWHRRSPATNWAKACTRFNYATVGKARAPRGTWRTDKGLRVGATETQLKKLYPAATSKRSRRYTVWTLATVSKISLQAWVQKGRIAYFRLRS